MKRENKLTFIGFIAIVLLDVVGSIASKQLNFEYSYLTIVSLLIYLIIAYKIAETADLRVTTLLSGTLGLFDGAIEFIISQLLEANTISIKLSASIVLFTAITMAVISSIIGIITWFVREKVAKRG